MTNVHSSVANQMLRNISDPKLRETYGNILSGKYAFKVYCLVPGKDPVTGKAMHAKKCPIGYVTREGRVIDIMVSDKKTGTPLAGIETSRDRLDGRKGFKCYCGNWSIQSPEEQGVLKTGNNPFSAPPPTKDEMEEIFARVQKSKKGAVQFINGWAEYDGFALEKVEQ